QKTGATSVLGTVINGGGTYTGIYAQHTAYSATAFPLSYPSGGSGSQELFAPLTRPPNGGCLSSATVALNSGGGHNYTFFVVFDYCGAGAPKLVAGAQIDDPNDPTHLFKNNYLVTNNHGLPIYATLSFTTDAVPTASSTWYMLLYNFKTNTYNLVSQATGTSGTSYGYSVYESAFLPGPCPSGLRRIAADYLQLYSAGTGHFTPVTPTMSGTTSVVINPSSATPCFNADSSGPATDTFAMINPNGYWNVTTHGVVTEFSAGITPSSGLYGITKGSDGNMWFTESYGNAIGRITPTGVVTEFATPSGHGRDDTTGPDGNVWFTEGASIGRITPAGVVSEFSSGITGGSQPEGIASGPDGNLWFTETVGRIGRITPSGLVAEFSKGISAFSEPFGITGGPDGNVWFTEKNGNRIGRITPLGAIKEFSTGITSGSAPTGITKGPDGNLWFTEDTGNRIGRITPTGTVTEFSIGITPGAGPQGITTGPDGNLWFTETARNGIGRITPAGIVTEFSSGVTGSFPYRIATGPDGNLWFTEFYTMIGRIEP
ncbi:MAG: hypothetical protein DLM50_02180, partial [Candidatus Meridianibacter frigidus]